MTVMAAVDIGAQSGRVALGRFDGETLSVDEVHRFPNRPVSTRGTLSWNALGLYDEILTGLGAVSQEAGVGVDSVGVDTWGVDFGLLDRAGRLLQNPVHHRDRRTDGALETVFAAIPPRELYERTGIQMMPINTLVQLAAMASAGDPALEAAETLLLMPDLFNYWLSGVVACEWTNATTSQCLDPRAQAWLADVLEQLGIPSRLFTDVVQPATVLGALSRDVAEAAHLRGAVVVAPATHDTGSAVAAVPFDGAEAVYISSGTWSLVGIERAEPVIDDRSFAANLTNEGGVDGTFRVLRNVTGLWLLHECRRVWALAGHGAEYADLVVESEQAPPLRSFIDPNDPEFAPPGDMPARIRSFCAATGQEVPVDRAAVTRCVLESLALKYRQTVELLADATDARPEVVHVVGGGALNSPLCRWTAAATGLPVLAGPAEATEIGNLAVQAIGLGELGSLAEAREVIGRSFASTRYEPVDQDLWEDAYGRFGALVTRAGSTGEEAIAS